MKRPWVRIPLKCGKFFFGFICNWLNWNNFCDNHSSFKICISAVHIFFKTFIIKNLVLRAIFITPSSIFLHVRSSEFPKSEKFLLPESGNRESFAREIWNLWLWSPSFCPENRESKFHWQAIQNPVPGMRNLQCRIQSLGLPFERDEMYPLF